MAAPAFKPGGFHQLAVPGLCFHDLLQRGALFELTVGPLMRLPGVPLIPGDTAVRRGSIKHGDTAHTGSCGLHRLILLCHPRPVVVGVAPPLVIHGLTIGPLTPEDIVVGVGDSRVHRCQHHLQILGACLLGKLAITLGLRDNVLKGFTLV